MQMCHSMFGRKIEYEKYYFINIIMYFLPDRMPGNGK